MPTYDLGLEHVSLAFATKTIFTDVTQGVFEGDRIGIVGRNGDGKSTLLHLFKGTQEPDSGRVTKRGGLTFGMLDQRDPLDDDATVRAAALEGREDYEWAADNKSREIVEALLGGINLNARVGSLSGGQRRRADLARLLLKDWDILALDEPTNHLDVVTIHWLAEHLKNRWSKGQGALLLVTHDRWFLDEVCESMWEVHDGVIDPFEGGYSAYMLQRVERDRQADVRETKRRNLARKELAWLSRGARARSTKQKFHVKAARELIADVPPMRNAVELKQMATSRLGKQVVDLIDVTQIFAKSQGEQPVTPTDDTAADQAPASSSQIDIVPSLYSEPRVTGSVEVAVDTLADPRLVDAGVPESIQAAAEAKAKAEALAERKGVTEESVAPQVTSAAQKITVAGRKILDDVTWLIGPGDRFGIVGANGAGKSTLLNLIPRFYDATGGTVSIGGVNVRRLHQTDLRAMLGYVPQKGVLFTGDILSNLEFGGDVSEADAIRAAATAQAEDFIWSRPHHFLTPVAQGGANVSGGQRQRLSIARAIARHPQVYLFDDSFSALDYQTDAALRQALAKQTHDATVIIVAQRLSTILHADQILVLDGGRIVGCGTHAALLRGCETYREIALSQLSAAELGEEG